MQNLANPDIRPLPQGWSQHRDSNGSWYYVNTSVKPPQITYNHPSGNIQSLPPQNMPQNVAATKMPLSQQLYASTGNSTPIRSTPLLPPPSLRASVVPSYPSASLLSNGVNVSQPITTTAPAPGQYLPSMQLSPTSTLLPNMPNNLGNMAGGTQPYQQAQLQQQHSMTYPGAISAQKQLPSPPNSVIYNQVPTVGNIPPSLQPNRSIWGAPRNATMQYQQSGHTPLPPQRQYEPLTTELAARKAKEGYKVLKKITKSALRGAVAVTTGIPPQAFANATTTLVNSDIANALANSFANQDLGVAQEDLQAVLQGTPDANYEAVIAGLMAQQQQQQEQTQQQLQLLQQQGVATPAPTPPAVDYQALIAELQRIQNLANQQAAAAQTANMQLMAQTQQNMANASLRAGTLSQPQGLQPGLASMQLQQNLAVAPPGSVGLYNMQQPQLGIAGPPLQQNQGGMQLQQQRTGTLAGTNLAQQQQQFQTQQALSTYQQGLQNGQSVLLQHQQSMHNSMVPGYRPQGPMANPAPQATQFSSIPMQLQPNRPPSMQVTPHSMLQSQTHAVSPPPSSSSPPVYSHSHSPSIASQSSRPQSQAQMQPFNQMPASSSPSHTQSTSISSFPQSRPQSQVQSQPLNSMPNPHSQHIPTPPSSPPKVDEPYPAWAQAQGTTTTVQASITTKPPAYPQTSPVPPEHAYPTPSEPTPPPQKPSKPAQGTSPPPLALHQPQPVQPFEPPQVPPTPPQQMPHAPAKPEKPQAAQVQQPTQQPSQQPPQQPIQQPPQQPTQQPVQQPQQPTQPGQQQPQAPEAQSQQASQPPPLQSPYEAWQQQEAQAQTQAQAQADAEVRARQDATAFEQAQSEARLQAQHDAIAAYQQQVAQQQQAVQDALAAAQQQAQQQQQQQDLQNIYQQAFQQQQEALNAAASGQEEQESSLQNLIQVAYGQQAPADPTQDAQYQNLLQAAYTQAAQQQQQQQATDVQAMLQAAALQQQQTQLNLFLQQQQQQQLQLLQQQQAQQQAQQPSVLETLLGATMNQQQQQQPQDADGGGFNLMGTLTSGFESLSTSDDSQNNSENW